MTITVMRGKPLAERAFARRRGSVDGDDHTAMCDGAPQWSRAMQSLDRPVDRQRDPFGIVFSRSVGRDLKAAAAVHEIKTPLIAIDIVAFDGEPIDVARQPAQEREENTILADFVHADSLKSVDKRRD